MSWGSRTAGGCLASDQGGSDFLAFEEASLLIIRAGPKAANGARSGHWRACSIPVMMEVDSEAHSIDFILPRFTCN